MEDFTTDLENESGDKKQNINFMMTVFSNELIWKTLGRCLNVSDLKCCRLVNRKFNQMVMDETKFKDRVVLRVKKKKLTPEEFGKSDESWKKVSLNFPVENALNPSKYEWLYPLLTKVEFLSLRLHGKVPSSTAIDFHPLLSRLLAKCKKLKSLALEPDFIMRGAGRISEGKETLEKLEKLEILQPDYRTVNQFPEPEGNRRMVPEFVKKLRNVKVYKSYFAQFRMNLTSFPVGLGSKTTWMEAIFLYALCDTIVKTNRQHLLSHSFYDVSNLSEHGAEVSTFSNFETPSLMALEADCYNLELPIGIVSFINYLNSRGPLEQLDVTCHYYGPRDRSLLSGLIQSVARNGRSLKKLKLCTRLENLSDWVFLRNSSLQELCLKDCRREEEENEWIRQVMTNFSKSIEKLYLRGALLKEQKPLTEPLKVEYFLRLDPQLVTQLSIFNAGGLVDNQVADFICQNFKMLRKLNLSHANTNDEGFRQIAGLKGLQYLTLGACGISNKTLKLIRFIELRYLDVGGNLKTTICGIKLTMKECPSLETLIIQIRESDFTKEDGQKICPRLKFLLQPSDDCQKYT